MELLSFLLGFIVGATLIILVWISVVVSNHQEELKQYLDWLKTTRPR